MSPENQPPVDSHQGIDPRLKQPSQQAPANIGVHPGSHMLGLVLACGITWVCSLLFNHFESLTLATLGIVSEYYTLLACWVAYGHYGKRLGASISLAAIFFLLQIAVFIASGPLLSVPLVVALALANLGFITLKFIANELLIWVLSVKVEHFTEVSEAYSFRLRYGIGELLLATACVAGLLGLGKLEAITPDNEFFKTFLVLFLIGLFHFLLFWPTLLAGLSKYNKLFYWGLVILVFSFAVPLQIYVFENLLGNNDNALYAVLSLDIPYVVCLAIHLSIVNYYGFFLVIPQRGVDAAEDPTEDIFSSRRTLSLVTDHWYSGKPSRCGR